jgi:hypothetical protein
MTHGDVRRLSFEHFANLLEGRYRERFGEAFHPMVEVTVAHRKILRISVKRTLKSYVARTASVCIL